MPLAHLLASYPLSITSLTSHKWIVPLQVLIPRWVGFCMFQGPVGLSSELSRETGSFCHCCNSHRFLHSEVLRPQFSVLKPCVVCHAPQVLLLAYPHRSVGNPVHQAPPHPPGPPPCHTSSLPQFTVSTPPPSLDEYFFFNSLAVRLPCSLIFWHFWLFLIYYLFNCLLSFFWLCEQAQCVYLCLHLGWKSPKLLI